MTGLTNNMNWIGGWTLMLLGLASGVWMGLFFHRSDFLGGFNSWPRRCVRLGHIALMALGMLNLIYALAVRGDPTAGLPDLLASPAFLIAGISMPAACFLCAWRRLLLPIYVLPVVALAAALALMLWRSL